jgi:hypothetical protein
MCRLSIIAIRISSQAAQERILPAGFTSKTFHNSLAIKIFLDYIPLDGSKSKLHIYMFSVNQFHLKHLTLDIMTHVICTIVF